jgi:hypothetical protein
MDGNIAILAMRGYYISPDPLFGYYLFKSLRESQNIQNMRKPVRLNSLQISQ